MIDPLPFLRQVYGNVLALHYDLYERSEHHRRQHGPDCTVYPSSPANVPMWFFLSAVVQARRVLEVGCGLGYTAAVMAAAGGPACRVDTIESDSDHADLAARELSRVGLADRVRVLRGDARDMLPRLVEPYNIVFVDSDETSYPDLLPHFIRLTQPGGVLVTANISPERINWSAGVGEYLRRLVADHRLRTFVIPHFWRALSYRLPAAG